MAESSSSLEEESEERAPNEEKIEEILDTKLSDGKTLYLVKLVGKSHLHTKWLLAKEMSSTMSGSRLLQRLADAPPVGADPQFSLVERILDSKNSYFLVKWRKLPYHQVSPPSIAFHPI